MIVSVPRWEPVDFSSPTKVCTRCGVEKSKDQFPASALRRDGYYPYCKPCTRQAKKESDKRLRENEPDEWLRRRRAAVAAYKQRHPERVKEQERRQSLKSKFGITVEEYNALLKKQKHRCAICRCKPGDKNFAVDHNHHTKRVRGLLCSNCNTALGLFNDKPSILAKAQAYLEES